MEQCRRPSLVHSQAREIWVNLDRRRKKLPREAKVWPEVLLSQGPKIQARTSKYRMKMMRSSSHTILIRISLTTSSSQRRTSASQPMENNQRQHSRITTIKKRILNEINPHPELRQRKPRMQIGVQNHKVNRGRNPELMTSVDKGSSSQILKLKQNRRRKLRRNPTREWCKRLKGRMLPR